MNNIYHTYNCGYCNYRMRQEKRRNIRAQKHIHKGEIYQAKNMIDSMVEWHEKEQK